MIVLHCSAGVAEGTNGPIPRASKSGRVDSSALK
jgi:hypothetical protein